MWKGSEGDEVREVGGGRTGRLTDNSKEIKFILGGKQDRGRAVSTGKLFRIIAQVAVRGKGHAGRREVDKTGGRGGGGDRRQGRWLVLICSEN